MPAPPPPHPPSRLPACPPARPPARPRARPPTHEPYNLMRAPCFIKGVLSLCINNPHAPGLEVLAHTLLANQHPCCWKRAVPVCGVSNHPDLTKFSVLDLTQSSWSSHFRPEVEDAGGRRAFAWAHAWAWVGVGNAPRIRRAKVNVGSVRQRLWTTRHEKYTGAVASSILQWMALVKVWF